MMNTEINLFPTFDEFHKLNEATNTDMRHSLIGQLFQSRDIAHLAHLATDSYARHIALGEYYSGILDLTDKLAEVYQGISGKMKFSIPASENIEMVEHLTSLHSTITKYKDDEPTIEDEVANILDEIMALMSQTLYKLKELS